MEKRKKWDLPHWVTPGVFSGNFVVDEAVERISSVKPTEKSTEKPMEKMIEIRTQNDPTLLEQVEKLELELTALKEELASWEKRMKELEEEQGKERQYLYQVVLSLKKEWESERNEHRHN